MLATSAMPPRMMVKWLQRWNSSAAIRDAHRFPKGNFGDSKFHEIIKIGNMVGTSKFCSFM